MGWATTANQNASSVTRKVMCTQIGLQRQGMSTMRQEGAFPLVGKSAPAPRRSLYQGMQTRKSLWPSYLAWNTFLKFSVTRNQIKQLGCATLQVFILHMPPIKIDKQEQEPIKRIAEVIKEDESPVVLYFYATWDNSEKYMTEVFEELSSKFPALTFFQIEAEAFPDTSEAYEIVAVPTFVIIKKGERVERIEGAKAAELSNAVATHAKGVLSNPSLSANEKAAKLEMSSTKALNSRLKALTNSAPVMVFIKGTPQQPRCGFSRTLVDLLAEQQVKYSSFNILADEDVRQGLKTYSDWPTFPQVYVNGELIGGLDIVKELIASGEFADMIPKEKPLSERLQELIEKQPVMVFIKGSPQEPRCGFSRQMVKILDDRHVKYGYFDILSDDDVRQGLKTHVNWPTFPMLFYKGELLGGLDIIKEMIDSGEFDQVLTA